MFICVMIAMRCVVCAFIVVVVVVIIVVAVVVIGPSTRKHSHLLSRTFAFHARYARASIVWNLHEFLFGFILSKM